MDEISVHQVVEAVKTHLAMFAPSATARSRRISNRLLTKRNAESDAPGSPVGGDFKPNPAVSKFRELIQSEYQ
jgi:hypothetical protein